ncbi:hypothetical protein A5636_01875 [Mycobacterium asiaticum]|uniref:Transposase n=1 Tax=Mycobacterium asiaticum TaxID=1790 RepID=A0A1A3N922_MYCAS|nr:hypothetical protein A5636_01875 [Mycobacterium asiaticum]
MVLEGRSKSDVARDYDVSRQWVQQLCKRYESEGDAAFVARSRRPHRNPQAVTAEIEERIVRLRKTLTKRGLDAGADTISFHLAADLMITKAPAVSTIWRILKRRGFITPQPHKRGRDGEKMPRPTIHDLRHFAGTSAARVGNLRETMDRLGHSTRRRVCGIPRSQLDVTPRWPRRCRSWRVRCSQ